MRQCNFGLAARMLAGWLAVPLLSSLQHDRRWTIRVLPCLNYWPADNPHGASVDWRCRSQQTLDLDFEEVHLYAPDAAWLRPTPDGFERLPRERLRVFVGRNAAQPNGMAVLIERDDGRIAGQLGECQGVRYELRMGLSDARNSRSRAPRRSRIGQSVRVG